MSDAPKIGGLLNSLAGGFHKTEQDTTIAARIRHRAMCCGIVDRHFALSRELDYLLREHMHVEAAAIAKEMAEIAEHVALEMQSTTLFVDNLPCHAGYDYLTGKGYLLGLCEAAEAILLCGQAERQKWAGEWLEQIEGIRDHERRLASIKVIVRESPGIIQSDLLKQYPDDADSQTLYYADKRGEIFRTKKGRSYALHIARETFPL